jgi:hypothetical protein
MKCPKCGSVRTVNTILSEGANICVDCNARWTSWQQSIIDKQAEKIKRLEQELVLHKRYITAGI